MACDHGSDLGGRGGGAAERDGAARPFRQLRRQAEPGGEIEVGVDGAIQLGQLHDAGFAGAGCATRAQRGLEGLGRLRVGARTECGLGGGAHGGEFIAPTTADARLIDALAPEQREVAPHVRHGPQA